MARCRSASLLALALLFIVRAAALPTKLFRFSMNAKLVINCNASVADLHPSRPSTVASVHLFRVLEGHEMRKMASIRRVSGTDTAVRKMTNYARRHGWNFMAATTTALNASITEATDDNQTALYIRVWKLMAGCQDAGRFLCRLGYLEGGGLATQEVILRYDTRGSTAINSLSFSPVAPNNEYVPFQEMRVRCEALGPKDFSIAWTRHCPHPYPHPHPHSHALTTPWPGPTGRVNKPTRTPAVSSPCGAFILHQQNVDFTATASLDGCTIVCRLGRDEDGIQGPSQGLAIRIKEMDQAVFEEGGSMTVRCSADVAGLDRKYAKIASVILSRVSFYGDMPAVMALIRFSRNPSLVKSEKKAAFTAQSWTFKQPTLAQLKDASAFNVTTLRRVMSIEATKPFSRCSDAGVYLCTVRFLNGSRKEHVLSNTNYTGGGPVRIEVLQLVPEKPENHYGKEEEVMAICTALGPRHFHFQWHATCPTRHQPPTWPEPDGRIHKAYRKPALDLFRPGSSCNAYRHTQQITFTPTQIIGACNVTCQFGDARQSHGIFVLDSKDVTYEVGDRVAITCDADSADVEARHTAVIKVTMSREDPSGGTQTIADIRLKHDALEYGPMSEEVGDNDTRDLMNITAVKLQAGCSDRGFYRCAVEYLVTDNDSVATASWDRHYYTSGPIEIQQMAFFPKADETVETVTIVCVGLGPEDFVIQWARKCQQPHYMPWPSDNVRILKATKRKADYVHGTPNDCNTFQHRQALVVLDRFTLDRCDIICSFKVPWGSHGTFLNLEKNLTIHAGQHGWRVNTNIPINIPLILLTILYCCAFCLILVFAINLHLTHRNSSSNARQSLRRPSKKSRGGSRNYRR